MTDDLTRYRDLIARTRNGAWRTHQPPLPEHYQDADDMLATRIPWLCPDCHGFGEVEGPFHEPTAVDGFVDTRPCTHPNTPTIGDRLTEPDDGAAMIADERQRQITKEGWTTEWDDEHILDELPLAAVAYTLAALDDNRLGWCTMALYPAMFWPWHKDTFKPSDQIRNLTKAGALIAAEIDRLQRAQPGVTRKDGE